ncbi:hypothetical protein ABIE33_007089 [Ensifer sp. 4252]
MPGSLDHGLQRSWLQPPTSAQLPSVPKAAIAAKLTMSESLALSGTICTDLSRPTRISGLTPASRQTAIRIKAYKSRRPCARRGCVFAEPFWKVECDCAQRGGERSPAQVVVAGLQRHASYQRRKARCITLDYCMFLPLNRTGFKETCSSKSEWFRQNTDFSFKLPAGQLSIPGHRTILRSER